MKIRVRKFVPRSWFHPLGAMILARKLQPHFPSVINDVAMTLTVDREPYPDPWFAYVDGTRRTGDMMETFRKRHGETEYFAGLEFHHDEDGWPHWHMIIHRKGTYAMDEMTALWGRGIVYLQRIRTGTMRYFLKYITKEMDAPDWVREMHRMRRVRFSKGFLEGIVRQECRSRRGLGRLIRTIGERIDSWRAMVSVVDEDGHHRTIRLMEDFQEILSREIENLAELRAYTGLGICEFDLDDKDHTKWITKYLQPAQAPPTRADSSSLDAYLRLLDASSTSRPEEAGQPAPGSSPPTKSAQLPLICLPRCRIEAIAVKPNGRRRARPASSTRSRRSTTW